jgi:hypothetical protein
MFNPDRADEYKHIQEDANTLTLDRSTLLRAAAGDQDALNLVTKRSSDLYDDQTQKINDLGVVTSAGAQLTADSMRDEATKLQGVNERWQQYGDISAENQQKAKDAARITSDYLLDAVSKADSATRAVDDFGNTLVTLPDGREVVIDAKTGQASTDLSKFKTDTDGVIDHINGRDVIVKVHADTSDAERRMEMFIAQERNIQLGTRIVLPRGERVLP